jgi:hypothetical protein
MRARHRLSKFLLRSGQRQPSGIRPWTRPYLIWVAQLRFTQMAHVLEKKQKETTNHRCRRVDTVTPYQGNALIEERLGRVPGGWSANHTLLS